MPLFKFIAERVHYVFIYVESDNYPDADYMATCDVEAMDWQEDLEQKPEIDFRTFRDG